MPVPKKTPKSDPGEIAEFTVLSPLNHDGDIYAEGETVKMGVNDAAPLLASSVLRAIPKAAKTA